MLFNCHVIYIYINTLASNFIVGKLFVVIPPPLLCIIKMNRRRQKGHTVLRFEEKNIAARVIAFLLLL